jgi:hypothetical protein
VFARMIGAKRLSGRLDTKNYFSLWHFLIDFWLRNLITAPQMGEKFFESKMSNMIKQ